MKDRGLTTKENSFIWHWLQNGHNATKAYMDAGYKVKNEKVANVLASKLLAKGKVADEIKKHEQYIVAAQQITVERVSQELATIAFSKITDFLTVDEEAEDIEVQDGEGATVNHNYKYKVVKIKSTKDMQNIGAISAIKQGKHGIEIRLNDKIKALEILAKYLGMLVGEGEKPPEEKLDISKLTNEEVLLLYNLTNKAKLLNNG